MNILVVGLGSMGKRRIRLLKKYFPGTQVFGVDTSEERRQGAKEEFGIETSPELKAALAAYPADGVFVCTSPLYHRAIIMEALAAGKHVFTEINLLRDGYEEMIARAKEKNVKLFLSSTMNYRREIRYIQAEVRKQTGKLNYIYHVGQYLPDWHPWENYKNFFVGDKRTNGVREIMAIQFPWILKTFGPAESFNALSGNLTKLEIDYPDSFLLLVQHAGGHAGVLCFDIVSRSASTKLEIIGENLHMLWGGTPDSLQHLNLEQKAFATVRLYEEIDKHSGYSANIIENAYVDEIQAFMELVETGKQPVYTFADDLETLSLIDSIEAI